MSFQTLFLDVVTPHITPVLYRNCVCSLNFQWVFFVVLVLLFLVYLLFYCCCCFGLFISWFAYLSCYFFACFLSLFFFVVLAIEREEWWLVFFCVVSFFTLHFFPRGKGYFNLLVGGVMDLSSAAQSMSYFSTLEAFITVGGC